MTEPPLLGPQLVPSLLVNDLGETIGFYERLGFTRTGIYPREGTPIWGEVTRDGVLLQFYTDPPHGTPSEPVCSGTFYVRTRDVMALARELEEAELEVNRAWPEPRALLHPAPEDW